MSFSQLSRFLSITVVTLIGCGGPEVERISGRVLLDDKPLTEVSVCFWPCHDIQLGIMAAYAPQGDGSFVIHPDPEQGQGRAGEYKVLVTENEKIRVLMPRFPRKYGVRDRTPFEVNIAAGINSLDPFCMASDAETTLMNKALQQALDQGLTIPLLGNDLKNKR